MTATVLSLDVGGTKTLAAGVAADGRVVREWTEATGPGAADGDQVAWVIDFAARAAADLGRLGHPPLCVAAGFPEYVVDGRLTSHEVLDWAVQPHDAYLARDPGAAERPLVIDSDVRLGALGEARFGAGAGFASFLYVSLGTGLSSALVIDDRIWAGARGEAIGFGEFPLAVPADSADRATLETYSSGSAVQARYAERTGRRADGRAIAAAARAGDAAALDVLTSAGTALGEGIAALVAVLDPHAVVLGGGLGTADTPLRTAATEAYLRRSGRRTGAAALVPARCGHRSGMLGGAVAAFRAIGQDLRGAAAGPPPATDR